ncbi:MAG: peptide ABC transporter ATPase [Candidatus Bathyarchaeota archaeon B26-1]|nr:MAG: peptide ABC transporter ATPase [Candidatus Bathyarchaeota archaeon B26-1]
MCPPLLRVEDLRLYFSTRKGAVKAVDDVSFEVDRGETLALIGESGCGKSSLAKAIIRLLPRNVSVYEGHVYLNGEDLMNLDEEEFRKTVRWTGISMVSQAALNSLNPVIKVGQQVAEPLILHKGMKGKEALEKARETLQRVGIPETFADRYPFELSGGMRQRAIIAMTLITNPDLIILDEPTSALDVLTQANIMNLLKKIKRELNLSFIFITHDIALSSELADKVAVMYAGQIVELSDAERFYKSPLHPYSTKLMASVPTLRENKKLEFIPGSPPSLIEPPKGCRFAPRCPYRTEDCSRDPPLISLGDGCYVRCWLHWKG